MGGSSASVPDTTQASIAGINQQTANYPFSYLINALSQTGGDTTLTNPATGKPQDYNFSGLGTADVQNKVSDQMSQTLLDIQKGLGSQYIAQRLADLKQSDPTGYATYGQLFDQIQQEAAKNPPDMPLAQSTQSQINQILKGSTSLSPSEMSQVQNQANAQNVASGITLGNAPQQAVGTAAVNALDAQQNQAQAAAQQYLSEGVTPSDIQYRKLQQDMANYGAFANGQNPTAQFGSLSGAQQGAAPNPNTGYQAPTLNMQQGAQQGMNIANSVYGSSSQLANGTANPYMSGISMALQGVNVANQIGQQNNASNYFSNPYAATSPIQGAFTNPAGSVAAGAYVNNGGQFYDPLMGMTTSTDTSAIMPTSRL